MLIDMRIYRAKPGMMKDVMSLYEAFGKDVQVQHLGPPIGYFLTETGNVNEYVHIWIYQDASDREKRRKALFSDPAWLQYLKRSSELGGLLDQTNRLLTPVDFMDMPHLQEVLDKK